jgi:hypothetical protein
MNVARLPIA